jgi:NAD(P)-dependent dehydrogenase (short-subunit alcohol dehydrogenase family)
MFRNQGKGTKRATHQQTGSFPEGGLAVVIGASGAVGSALLSRLREDDRFAEVVGLSRAKIPVLDLTSEKTIAEAARRISSLGASLRIILDATGFLHGDGAIPEKSWQQLDAAYMAKCFAINAIGPALLMKHFLPLLPREGKSVFATLSAKVGSIGDNRLGGWYSYRASKAALNQLVRTAAIELKRRRPEAICVALHPGTVDSKLSAPFAKGGLEVRSPSEAANRLLEVIDKLTPAASGRFFDYRGEPLPW